MSDYTDYSKEQLLEKFPIDTIVRYKGLSKQGTNTFSSASEYPIGIVTRHEGNVDPYLGIRFYKSEKQLRDKSTVNYDYRLYGEQVEIVVDTTNMLNFIETQLDRLEEKLKQ